MYCRSQGPCPRLASSKLPQASALKKAVGVLLSGDIHTFIFWMTFRHWQATNQALFCLPTLSQLWIGKKAKFWWGWRQGDGVGWNIHQTERRDQLLLMEISLYIATHMLKGLFLLIMFTERYGSDRGWEEGMRWGLQAVEKMAAMATAREWVTGN